MNRQPKDQRFKLIFTAVFFVLSSWQLTAQAAGPAASAIRQSKENPLDISTTYEIKNGDNLGAIAITHGVTVDELMEANEMTDPDRIFAGQKLIIPGDPKNGRLTKRGVILNIPKGFTLTRIAAAYDIPLKTILRANKIKNADRIRENQELLIPGAKSIVKLVLPPPCYKDPVTLYRVRSDETRVVSLCYCNGRPNPDAVEILSRLSAPPKKEMPFPLHPRLAVMLQRVAEKYQGKRIEIISGQRVSKTPGNESYHNKGQAIDFRVAEVSNKTLVSFVRTFDNTGVGYYPNSVFIHMDTRERDAYWVDYSRPGEKAIYGRKGMTESEIAAIREQRKKPIEEQIAARTDQNIKKFIQSVEKQTPKITRSKRAISGSSLIASNRRSSKKD